MLGKIRNTLGKFLGFQDRTAIDAAALAMLAERFAKLRGSYDAARTSDEYKNIWSNSDRYDADSAHSREVRHALISRSRYEINNNGYADGITSTYATDLVGVGPTLRMQTNSPGFNQMVELSWYLWSKAVHFRRKLWCMAHAKHSDGEAFAVLRRNPGVKHPIPLDVCLYEAEQVQSPYDWFAEEGHIDGIHFDKFGNPVSYDILHQHPGTMKGLLFEETPEQVPANRVLHWFKMRRPGQHRAVPESSSTLNTGAAARRWREATLAAAETAADFSVFLKTAFQPDQVGAIAPMDTLDIQKRMMTALPAGWEATQMKAEHPSAGFAEFHKTLIGEQARPRSMPYNRAAADSSGHNFASGKLDFLPYFSALDVDREDCNDVCLDPLFDVWFSMAIARFGWLSGDPDAVGPGARLHIWDWPQHKTADVEADANAKQTQLKSGQLRLGKLYSDAGLDYEDELEKMAAEFGVSIDEMRGRLLDVVLPPIQQGGAPGQAPPAKPVDESVAARLRERALLNNGAHYG